MIFTTKRLLPFYLFLFILLADQVVKGLTHHYLPLAYSFSYPYGGIGLFQDFFGIEFSISHQINRGAAWGMFAQYQQALLAIRIAFVIGLIIYFFFYSNKKCKIPLAMITAGASGNIIDFFLYGHVVDMIHFVFWNYDFPVFNIADSSIFLGIVSLIYLSSMENKKLPDKI